MQQSDRNTTVRVFKNKKTNKLRAWTLPAGAPLCSGSGLTAAGFPHPYPLQPVHVGLSAMISTKEETAISIGSGAWTLSQGMQFYRFPKAEVSLFPDSTAGLGVSHTTGLRGRTGC